MTILWADIEARKRSTEDELIGMYGDGRTERRRTLTAELMVLDDWPMEISRGRTDFFETEMKLHAERGNLNYAAGLERVIKWMKTYDHV